MNSLKDSLRISTSGKRNKISIIYNFEKTKDVLKVGTKHTYLQVVIKIHILTHTKLFLVVDDNQIKFCHVDQASVSVVGP